MIIVYQGFFLLGNENHRNSYTNCLPNCRPGIVYFANNAVKSRSLYLVFTYFQVNFLAVRLVNLKL